MQTMKEYDRDILNKCQAKVWARPELHEFACDIWYLAVRAGMDFALREDWTTPVPVLPLKPERPAKPGSLPLFDQP
jgi:hypothetical protein